MKQGRPLRFLAMVLAGWTAVRVAIVWPNAPEPGPVAARAAPPGRDDNDRHIARLPPPVAVVSAMSGDRSLPDERRGAVARVPAIEDGARRQAAPRLGTALRGGGEAGQAKNETAQAQVAGIDQGSRTDTGIATVTAPSSREMAQSILGPVPPPEIVPVAGSPSRLRGDAWVIARATRAGDNLAFGQLGASQTGLRLTYAVDGGRHVALSARASTPLRGAGREAGLGIDWQPARLPVHALVEERLPLDGGAARPAAQLIAGTAARLPFGLRAEGYAQAGAVYRRGGFVDAAARVTRPSPARLDLGAGAWGAAQRDAARFDIGPTLGMAVPAGGVFLRLAVDYRFRVAGHARPGSGPTISLGTSF